MWIGPMFTAIAWSAGLRAGRLLVFLWDEDDLSGGSSAPTIRSGCSS